MMESHTDESEMKCKGESNEGTDELPSLVSDSVRPHLAWSQCIKQQHYHLQRAFCSFRECNSESGASEGFRKDGGVHEPSSQTSDDDLNLWQRIINSKEERERLQDYARAMHCLATKYWEAPLPQLKNSTKSGKYEEKDQGCRPPTTTISGVPFTAAAGSTDVVSSRKRSRESSTASTNTATEEGERICLEDIRQRRYDDRIQSSLDCVEAFYLGRPSSGETKEGPQLLFHELPLVFSRALKPWRRDFFREHARMATKAEIEDRILQLSPEDRRAAPPTGGSAHTRPFSPPPNAWDQSMRYVREMRRVRGLGPADEAFTGGDSPFSSPLRVPALHALDVGSCYGPFFGKSFAHTVLGAVPLHVAALDLCPSAHSRGPSLPSLPPLFGQVWKGDWLSVAFFRRPLSSPAGGDHAPYLRLHAEPLPGEAGPAVRAIAVEAFDAVFFCLFLSYLPSARLRYRACVNAYLSLKEGGVLVLVSTRTQGSRRRRWVEEWVEAVSSIGFARVHQTIREKIVVLCFEKKSHPEMRKRLDGLYELEQEDAVPEAVGVLLEELNRSPFALNGLHVMADEDI